MPPLNIRQSRFVAEYIKTGNGTQSAITAGYSPKTAAEQASRLLTNIKIAAAVARPLRNQGITIERVAQEAARLAFLNPQDFYDADGRMLSIKEMPEEAARAIAGLEEEEIWSGKGEDRELIGRLKKIKLAAKVPALELLGRHLGMFHDSTPVGITFAIQINLGGTEHGTEPA